MKIIVELFCLKWHLTDSLSMHDHLINPLSKKVKFQLNTWDGNVFPKVNIPKNRPIIFHEFAPPASFLRNYENVTWIPMWDNAYKYSKKWWGQLPQNLKIVAFSDSVFTMARQTACPTLRLIYFKDPHLFPKASWNEGLKAFYWNRTGLLSKEMIEKVCRALNIRKFYIRPDLDPGIPIERQITLPSKIGKTDIITITRFEDRLDYYDFMANINIYFAPRALEGIGISFLEAMASGCCVFANDSATMNEYIKHRNTGILWQCDQSGHLQQIISGRQSWTTLDYIGNSIILSEGALKNGLCYLFCHRKIKPQVM